MASTAKYARAPTSEPDDLPPPAYSAPGPSTVDDGGIFADPRDSEDNIPDDFKVRAKVYNFKPPAPNLDADGGAYLQFGGSVAEATKEIRNMFVRKVYAILTLQLIATAAVSAVSFMNASYKTWIQAHPGFVWVSLIGSIVFLCLTWWKRKSYPTNLIFLSAFTLTEAYSVSVIVSFFDTGVVLNAVVLTAAIFVFLTLFACQTRYDFTSWMPYLFGGVWALVIFGFMAMWFPYNSTTELLLGGVSALIFSAYILVDTQLVLRKHHVEEEIAAAISLYLDIINLFLAILRILNSQSNR